MNDNSRSSLHEYIKLQVNRGQSLIAVKNTLLGNGWQEHIIDEAIINLSHRENNNLAKNKLPKMLIILVVILLFSGSGFALHVSRKEKLDLSNNNLSNVKSQKKVNTNNMLNSRINSNWKTYENEKYKYSIQYPPDWEYEDVYDSMIRFRKVGKKGETITLNNQNNQKIEAPASYDLVINAYDNAGPNSIEKYIQSMTNDPMVPGMTSKTSTIMVDKKQATKVVTYLDKASFTTTVLLLSGNTMYNFLTINNDPGNFGIVASDAATIQANKDNSNFKNAQIVDQMISSFRLIVQE
ncbi:hypothetical protein COZ61_02385 [Candidatus Berkelbacteria bacterium CG_4_8_14_3_um_filter_33_6]|uniref:Uncharacterized protein n=1 Tax=Candidatus Berkelbacteria bacterium CG_4_10_14_0_2_um_filter_35_9_33_12 TaxID=1974499 RepID=A0A2M7W495_9BACT|nr:MAG: hypothetical protein COX10_01415 [Candidatus Berkelbacteria bacterium CG23_combo_of_CG06-09_8_20_14_all_33_15]PIX30952.1 MAG: hypothetical protein COZ61_02385 [Candidatus Berkelbacteria bacterium CG_4_8_14_3_um_filter_33_6]PIZ28144.1 MAG: hypothetical protein COY43_02040 [Candidatus Berkelbacteria bacterium CG_4_10_14_0_8_um_filter_35_9_33_8]PJA20504.1 MAG: hypothetical protein COX60_01430 [Candidatus Berkelbacteria bacterium CG_4_10_14_0_2_um_filter_35_9_33_12]